MAVVFQTPKCRPHYPSTASSPEVMSATPLPTRPPTLHPLRLKEVEGMGQVSHEVKES